MRKNTEAFIYIKPDNTYVVINPKTGKKVEEVDELLVANIRCGEFNNIQGFFAIPIVETNKMVVGIINSNYWNSISYFEGKLFCGLNEWQTGTGVLWLKKGRIMFRVGWDHKLPTSKIKELNTKPNKEIPRARTLDQDIDDRLDEIVSE